MKIRSLLLLPIVLLFVISCEKTNLQTSDQNQVVRFDNIEIVKVGEFKDDIAYNSVRAVYRIKDIKTNQEYIGISGVGITEYRRVQSGKTPISKEVN